MGLLDRWLSRFLAADDSAAAGASTESPPREAPGGQGEDPHLSALHRVRHRLTLTEAGSRYAESAEFGAELRALDQAGRSRAADALLADALLVTTSLPLRRQLAERLLHRGEHEQARPLLERLTLNPTHAEFAWLALGDLEERRDQPEQARAAYEHVLALDITSQAARSRLRRLGQGSEVTSAGASGRRDELARFLGTRAAGERYEVLEELGRGGAATVYRVRDRQMGREVALKLFHPRGRAEVRRARILEEARVAGRFDHPHITPVLDVDEVRESIIMGLCNGGSLRQRLTQEKSLPSHETAELGAILLKTLADVHEQGKAHLDIKPSNLLFHDGRLMLADFGSAGLEALGAAAATRAYMAPERRQGRTVGAPADLYAVGLVLYECLVGKLPEADALQREKVALSCLPPGPRRRGLERVLGALMKLRPEERPSAPRELAEELIEAAALPVEEHEGRRLLASLERLAADTGPEAMERLQCHRLWHLLAASTSSPP